MLVVYAGYINKAWGLTSVPAAAGVLFLTLALSTVSALVLGPSYVQPFLLMDAVCAALFVWQWRTNDKQWSLALACLFGVQCVADASYQLSAPHSLAERTGYEAFLNVIFVAQLVCVCIPAYVEILSRWGQSRQ